MLANAANHSGEPNAGSPSPATPRLGGFAVDTATLDIVSFGEIAKLKVDGFDESPIAMFCLGLAMRAARNMTGLTTSVVINRVRWRLQTQHVGTSDVVTILVDGVSRDAVMAACTHCKEMHAVNADISAHNFELQGQLESLETMNQTLNNSNELLIDLVHEMMGDEGRFITK